MPFNGPLLGAALTILLMLYIGSFTLGIANKIAETLLINLRGYFVHADHRMRFQFIWFYLIAAVSIFTAYRALDYKIVIYDPLLVVTASMMARYSMMVYNRFKKKNRISPPETGQCIWFGIVLTATFYILVFITSLIPG